MGQKMTGKMKRLPMKMRDLMRKSHLIIYMALTALALASCGEDTLPTDETATDKGVEMKLLMSHPSNKAPTAPSYFEAGDKVGLFVSEDGKPLEVGGNVVNNEALTFNGNEWTATKTLYWDEGLYNVYAYHPYIGRVSSIEDQPFSVSLDQRTEKTATALGGYKASDLLFATSKGVRASDEPVQLAFRHIMSKITIRLVKGEDFEGEMPKNAHGICAQHRDGGYDRPPGGGGHAPCEGSATDDHGTPRRRQPLLCHRCAATHRKPHAVHRGDHEQHELSVRKQVSV